MHTTFFEQQATEHGLKSLQARPVQNAVISGVLPSDNGGTHFSHRRHKLDNNPSWVSVAHRLEVAGMH